MGVTGDMGVVEFLSELAAPQPAPAAGGALAVSAATAAALTEMAAGISAKFGGAQLSDTRLVAIAKRASELRAEAIGLGCSDEQAYGAVIEAMRLDKDDPQRAIKVTAALSAAADPPLRISDLCAETAELAAEVVEGGRASVRGDALAGVLLAEATTCGASRLVDIDVESAVDPRVAQATANANRALDARSAALRS